MKCKKCDTKVEFPVYIYPRMFKFKTNGKMRSDVSVPICPACGTSLCEVGEVIDVREEGYAP